MKKFLSIAMSAVLAASMMALPAAADEADDFDPGTGKVYYLNFKPEVDQQWQDLAAAYTAQLAITDPLAELGDDPALLLTLDLVPLGSDGIDLVDEYDAGRVLLCILEDLPELSFGFSVELAHDLRSADGDEVAAGLSRHGFGEHGLTGSRRSVEQNSLGCLDTQPLEELGVF